ncbi:MAG: hypothetical protein LBQ60_12035 [Bacteroidales bacterium]|nr:hypothetical protein [Bacteroidales bacterium]
MKTKVLLLTILLVATMCMVNARDKKIQGTWKLVNEQLDKEGGTQIKLITPTHFMWMMYDKAGKIHGGATGTYTAKDNTYVETLLTHDEPVNEMKAVYEYKIHGKTMTIKGYLEREGVKVTNINEVWLKID